MHYMKVYAKGVLKNGFVNAETYTACRNNKNKCANQICSLVSAQFLAFFKTISFDFTMLILHC